MTRIFEMVKIITCANKFLPLVFLLFDYNRIIFLKECFFVFKKSRDEEFPISSIAVQATEMLYARR